MNKPLKQIALMAALLLLTSCSVRFTDVPAGELQRQTYDVAAEDAKTVNAQFEIGAGELNMRPASLPSTAMHATLTYNANAGNPEMNYSVANGIGELMLSQTRSDDVIYLRNYRNTWDVQLSNTLTERLLVAMGAGQSNLKLGGLPLREAQIATGAGNVLVDLTGKWENDANIDISAGLGRVEVRLPDETSVEVIVNGHMGVLNTPGLNKVDSGTYRNSAYGQSSTRLHVNVSAGLGELVLSAAR